MNLKMKTFKIEEKEKVFPKELYIKICMVYYNNVFHFIEAAILKFHSETKKFEYIKIKILRNLFLINVIIFLLVCKTF